MFSDKQFGLSSSLIAASRGILGEEKEDKDKIDPKMMKGGKTKVELEPKTDDDTRDYDDKKKSMKEGKEHTVPKTDKEKKLAALASPKDKITHKDVMVGRGVVNKEEADIEEAINMRAVMDRAERKTGAAEYKTHMRKKAEGEGSEAEAARRWLGHKPGTTGADVKKMNAARMNKEEVELDEASMFSSKVKQGKGAAADIGSARYDFGKNAAPRRPDDTGKNVLSRRVFIKGAKPKGKLPEEVELSDEELERLEAIAQSLDEAKPTIVSAPIRGANQDQSGENTKSTSTDYTISDSKKMKKEEVELDELKKSTLGSYIKKATSDITDKSRLQGGMVGMGYAGDDDEPPHPHYTKIVDKLQKRKAGIHKAVNQLTKEEVELDEAKRGRPKKNPTPDDEQEEHEHVIMQLRKVVSTHGALPVKHLDGKSTKITPQLAQHALNKHSAMKTAAEKQDFESKMHKSHDSMKSALGQ